MASSREPVASDFMLTPQQQDFLFAALKSTKNSDAPASNTFYPSPSLTGLLDQATDGFGNPQDHFPVKYDYELGGVDLTFDFSLDSLGEAGMIAVLPESSNGTKSENDVTKSESVDADTPEKRAHPDDEEEERQGEAKRRESEGKVTKKPGRKPLTTEPTNKRKAQNRAAQRAFRERKEKHLKDLETKVEELQKASKSTTQENELLRAQIEKLTAELNEYKKQPSLLPNWVAPPSMHMPALGRNVDGLADVNFAIEFPTFGFGRGQKTTETNDGKPPVLIKRTGSGQLSPLQTPRDGASPGKSSSYGQIALDQKTKDNLANFSVRPFNPPRSHGHLNGSISSLDALFTGVTTTMNSPSTSSNSNGGISSPCGTSPELLSQSPGPAKSLDTLSTIGEEKTGEQATSTGFGSADLTGDYNWLPQNLEFEPQLFGGYREPQDNILSNGFDDSLFNDALDVDFITPYNLPPKVPGLELAQTFGLPKKNLIAQIDEAKNSDDVVGDSKTLTCNKIREQLQNCPKIQSGGFDLDGLCYDLQKKARCTGAGAVVNETDFQNVMQKYLGKDEKVGDGMQKS